MTFSIEGAEIMMWKRRPEEDEHGDDDLFTDEESEPIIAEALADLGETYSAEEVFAELRERIDAHARRADAA